MLTTWEPGLVWEEEDCPRRQEPRAPPTHCLSWGDPAPFLEAGLCAFAPLCLPALLRRPLLQRLGAWPFSQWALCLGQGQHFIAQEDEMSVPTWSHTGKKEVGQKSWVVLWCVGGFVQDALLRLTTRRYWRGC